ncbi:MAG: hypothetical protein AUG51_12410 [Acidobacteria bacterium 13_1_20CM_3_53_8]|nr:MAG: hypothetical protein AUG51_12410 [Acidobacteria bacterium 13_1_20CM_3_53_8]
MLKDILTILKSALIGSFVALILGVLIGLISDYKATKLWESVPPQERYKFVSIEKNIGPIFFGGLGFVCGGLIGLSIGGALVLVRAAREISDTETS